MGLTHWIYPTSARSGYELGNPDSVGEVSPARLRSGIEQEPDVAHPWVLSAGFRIMRPGDAVWVYAAAPYQYICGLAQVNEVYPDGDAWYVDLLWHLDATRRLMDQPITRAEFGQIAQRAAVRADETTVGVLEAWLDGAGIDVAKLDGSAEDLSDEDTRLRTLRSIVQRQGQAVFRERLLTAYGRRCAVTGEAVEAVLEAAHIEPYRGAQSNVVSNGLLLRGDLHTLFDLHLISVDADGCLVVSSQLQGSTYAGYHGRRLAVPHGSGAKPSRRSLARHLKLLA